MCGSAVQARVRNGDATTARRGTFHPSTAHVTPSRGLMGRIPASDRLRQATDQNQHVPVEVARWRGPRPRHTPDGRVSHVPW